MPKRTFSKEEKEQLKITMLEAGFPLIKEYGMTHTTVSKVTDSAGIAKGTFYHFWKDKEHYMVDLIAYHRKKMIPKLVNQDVMTGKKKLGRKEAAAYFHMIVDPEISIYPHMTLEDEAKLINNTNAFIPDTEKESSIVGGLLNHLENVRENPDLLLIANMSKVLVITAESKQELHEKVYQKTIDTLIESILNLIFEQED